jgi:branched-chain amino acid transport system permease protein
MMARASQKWILLTALAVFLLFLPWSLGNYLTYLINLSGIYTVAILGLNILMGLGGQMFFGGVAMMALGAYASAALTNYLGIPFYLSILLSGFITSVLSLVIIFPALRVRGLYLAMVSVGFHLILDQVIGHWDSFTGGYNGLSLPKVTLAGISMSTDRAFYYVVLAGVAFSLWSASNLMKMRVGRAIWALGQDAVASAVLGLNVTYYKVVAFLLCAFYCGISGGLLAHYLRFITPDHFTIVMAIMLLVGMIIGGWGSLTGSIAGGFFVTFLPEVIGLFKDYFLGASTALYDVQATISGIIIMLVVIFIPHGFAEWVKGLRVKWRYQHKTE